MAKSKKLTKSDCLRLKKMLVHNEKIDKDAQNQAIRLDKQSHKLQDAAITLDKRAHYGRIENLKLRKKIKKQC